MQPHRSPTAFGTEPLAYGATCSLVIALLLCAAAPAVGSTQITTRDVDYDHDGVALRGYIAHDAERQTYHGAVLVVHEWWGLNDYARRRARQLAELGYVAFALDMYGADRTTDDPQQAGRWARELYQDRAHLRGRAGAGFEALWEALREMELDLPVAAIGYCFGGTVVTELAWGGADVADLVGVVSFHGNPMPPLPGDTDRITASVLICHGGADPAVPQDQLDAYITGLEEADADWLLIVYADAKHSFTNPASAERESDSVGYHEAADRRSWGHMKQFLEEVSDQRR